MYIGLLHNPMNVYFSAPWLMYNILLHLEHSIKKIRKVENLVRKNIFNFPLKNYN